MTREEALKIWLPIVVMSVSDGRMPEVKEAVDMAIKALEQDLCEDAISREAMLEIQAKYAEHMGATKFWQMCDDIKALPSVTPTEKVGHWIQTNDFFISRNRQFIYQFICSECSALSYFRKSNKKIIGADICPNCGAKMEELEE